MQPQDPPKTEFLFPVSFLPPELVLVILRYMWNRSACETKSLHHCSLVCRQWRPIAQALLFTEVILDREVSAQSFISATQGNPSLGSTVKSLELHVASDPDSSLELLTAQVSHSASYAATSRCPRLYRLKLVNPGSLNTALLTTLVHPHTFVTLRALELNMEEKLESVDHYLTDFFRFLHHFQHLSHLRLQGIGGELERPSISPTSPPSPSFHLVDFSWINEGSFQRLYPTSKFKLVTDWLFPKSPRNLRILEFRDAHAEWDDFRQFLSNHGRSLDSIRLLLNKYHIGQNDARLISLNLPVSCPSLREVIIPDSYFMSPVLRSALPLSKLEHLRFATLFDYMDQIKETFEWFRSMPNLRRLTLWTSW
ncbi:hypothetical protein FRC03_007947, partial [Tulasnella sp. 419]